MVRNKSSACSIASIRQETLKCFLTLKLLKYQSSIFFLVHRLFSAVKILDYWLARLWPLKHSTWLSMNQCPDVTAVVLACARLWHFTKEMIKHQLFNKHFFSLLSWQEGMGLHKNQKYVMVHFWSPMQVYRWLYYCSPMFNNIVLQWITQGTKEIPLRYPSNGMHLYSSVQFSFCNEAVLIKGQKVQKHYFLICLSLDEAISHGNCCKQINILSQTKPTEILQVTMSDVLMWQCAEESLRGKLLDEALCWRELVGLFQSGEQLHGFVLVSHTFTLLI